VQVLGRFTGPDLNELAGVEQHVGGDRGEHAPCPAQDLGVRNQVVRRRDLVHQAVQSQRVPPEEPVVHP